MIMANVIAFRNTATIKAIFLDPYIFLISYSVCRWQAFHVFHCRVGSCPYPQTLDQAGKACQVQALLLIMKSRNLPPIKGL